jgi:RNA polymerase primary sigma factor
MPTSQGQTDSVETSGPGPRDPNESLLALYYRDVGRLPVLRAHQEFEMARELERAEVDLWAHLLSNPKLVGPILALLQRRLGEQAPDLTELRRSVREAGSRPSAAALARYGERCEETAQLLRAADVDRDHLDAVIHQLRMLQGGERDTIFSGTRVNTSSRSFKKYLRRALTLRQTSQRLRQEFIQANLRLVVTIARRFNFGQIPLHDLIQEGNIGLIRAIGRYDHRRGFRFSTYASWWIRHTITRAMADKGRLVRVPVHMMSTFLKLDRTRRELSSRLGRSPTAQEVSTSASVDAETVERIHDRMPGQAFSLDSKVSEENDRRFIDLVEDENLCSPLDRIGDQQVYEQVQQILGELRPIESDVLRRRFGLQDGREHTLVEIGASYDLSRERIRQIQEQALAKIRRRLVRQKAI